MVHLGLLDKCVRTCESPARKMRREPSRKGPGSRSVGPWPGVGVLPTRIPAARGARPLLSRRKCSLQSPAGPLLALLLLVSIKQVRTVFVIIIVIIISCTYFLIIEAI